MAGASVQLNVRMDHSLREAGDAALASKGYAPAEFVRLVWEKAARRGQDLEDLLVGVMGARGRRPEEGAVLLAPPIVGHSGSADAPQEVHWERMGWEAKREKLWAEFLQAVGLTEDQVLMSHKEHPYDETTDGRLGEQDHASDFYEMLKEDALMSHYYEKNGLTALVKAGGNHA